MTTDVVTVSPDTLARDIARALLARGISAAPVVDGNGALVGMVSEGDLIGREATGRRNRREWWLTLLAEGEVLNPDFLAIMRNPGRPAREIMSAPVVSVGEDAQAADIAGLLVAHRIKRVPVVRDGRVTGIVSRADLLRALAPDVAAPAAAGRDAGRHGLLANVLAAVDERFGATHRAATGGPSPEPVPPPAEAGPALDDFRALAADFEHRRNERQATAVQSAADQRRQRVKEMIDHHVEDQNWRALLHHAREAAEHGEKEFMLLRFPADLCADRGRAINAPSPDWPETLRGEAAEMYLRWKQELAPRGFHLTARVLDFPGGFPGDVGLFLGWGE